MREIAKPVVTGNSHGQLTRRDLLFSLLALPLSSKLAAQTSKAAIRTNSLNNVMISVTDMARSVPFYEKLFGPSIKQGNLALFRLARSPRFFALSPVKAGEKPGTLCTASPSMILTLNYREALERGRSVRTSDAA